MHYRKLILLFIIICMIPLALADLEQYQEVTLKISCFDDNNDFCDTETNCTITVHNPFSVTIVEDANMTYNPTFFNYTVEGSLNDRIGTYEYVIHCSDGISSDFIPFSYYINRNINKSDISSLDTCPITEDTKFILAYFLIIALLFLILILNETIFKLPMMSFLIGVGMILVSIPLYSCHIVLGATLSLFGLLLFVWEINQLSGNK